MFNSVESKKLKYQNRIALLQSRNKENGNIIKKLQRQLKNLENNQSK